MNLLKIDSTITQALQNKGYTLDERINAALTNGEAVYSISPFVSQYEVPADLLGTIQAAIRVEKGFVGTYVRLVKIKISKGTRRVRMVSVSDTDASSDRDAGTAKVATVKYI